MLEHPDKSFDLVGDVQLLNPVEVGASLAWSVVFFSSYFLVDRFHREQSITNSIPKEFFIKRVSLRGVGAVDSKGGVLGEGDGKGIKFPSAINEDVLYFELVFAYIKGTLDVISDGLVAG